MGKGEIVHYKQFLLFPQCFLRVQNLSASSIKFEIVCKPFQFGRVLNSLFGKELSMIFMVKLVTERVVNIAGKEENSGCQNFLLYPQCFQRPLVKVIKAKNRIMLCMVYLFTKRQNLRLVKIESICRGQNKFG